VVHSIAIEPELKILCPTSSINAANSQEFQRQLLEEISASTTSVLVVNMDKVEYIDSAGLMALVSGMNLSKTLEKRLIISNIAPSVRMVFELTQLDEALEIFESKEELTAIA
jgi:anti-sigma B factor antagonist